MLSLFIARKYFARALATKATSASLWLSLIVLCAGSLALSLALSITQAFEEKVFQKLQGINAHAIIYSHGDKVDGTSITATIKKKHPDTHFETTPQSMHSIVILHNNHQALITLRGIEPATEKNVLNLAQKITPQKTRSGVDELLTNNSVIIGHSLAKQLEVNPGDEFSIHIPQDSKSSKRISLYEKTVQVSAFFNIGLDEFDGNTMFCSLQFFNEIFKVKQGSDVLLVNFEEKKDTSSLNNLSAFFNKHIPFQKSFQDNLIGELKNDLPSFTVASWKDLYPAIISAMQLEKCGVLSLILLLTLVALMNIISTLFTIVNRKQRDIALFQAIGMPNTSIKQIFIWMGMCMVTFSTATGVALGWFVSFLLESYKLIPLPDMYYTPYLPACTDPGIFIAVALVTLFIGYCTILLSVRHLQNTDPLETLRHTA